MSVLKTLYRTVWTAIGFGLISTVGAHAQAAKLAGDAFVCPAHHLVNDAIVMANANVEMDVILKNTGCIWMPKGTPIVAANTFRFTTRVFIRHNDTMIPAYVRDLAVKYD